MNNPVKSQGVLGLSISLIVAGGCLIIYWKSGAPGLLFGDPGEFQMAAWRWGLAHPTGYPLYLILGGLWQRILTLVGLTPAAALNRFSALAAAATVGVLALAVVRWSERTGRGHRGNVHLLSSLFAGLLLAFNPYFWSQALVAEVYALHALFIALFILLASRLGRSEEQPQGDDQGTLLWMALLVGLSFTHHRTSIFLLPTFFWMVYRYGGRRLWLPSILLIALPQLLYLYIPLRSGPADSPWLYQQVGGETLRLYAGGLRGFIDILTGRVFAVSILDVRGALERLPQMVAFWVGGFTLPGLALILLGIGRTLVSVRSESSVMAGERVDQGAGSESAHLLLWSTLPFLLFHQLFNLFYGIGDIHDFYIALFIVGAFWGGLGFDRLLTGRVVLGRVGEGFRIATVGLLFAIPLWLFVSNYQSVDRSDDHRAREMWETILRVLPEEGGFLVSNDRNEIAPLYYLQAVEGRGQNAVGLFPLIQSGKNFADIGSTLAFLVDRVEERPIYLVKPMPGLEARFELTQVSPPLQEVVAPVRIPDEAEVVDLVHGPLLMRAYELDMDDNNLDFVLYWDIVAPVDVVLVSSLQLFDGAGERVGQLDRPAGGAFYPSSLWKPGETIRDRFELKVSRSPVMARVLLYSVDGEELRPLAPPLQIGLE